MKVEVILTADEKLLNVLDKFANALTILHNVKPSVDESVSVAEAETPQAPQAPQVEQPTAEAPKTAVETKEPKQEPPKPKVAKPKQEEVPAVEDTPQEDNKPVAETKPTVATETQKTEETQVDVPDAPTLRAAAKKLMEAGKQAELKATLNGFTDASGEPVQKLSGLQDADKAKFITAVHELLGE